MTQVRSNRDESTEPGDARAPRSGSRARNPFRVAAVVFDFDGTLTRSEAMDFPAMRAAIGCPPEEGLLEFLDRVEDQGERRRLEAVMHAAEMEAADRSEPSPGAEELVMFLRQQGVPAAIITRNTMGTVERALAHFPCVTKDDFALIVSRDMPFSPKPFPDGVLFLAERLAVDPSEMLVVGDHFFDIEAGVRAGALTMFLRNATSAEEAPVQADFVVDDLIEALRVIRYGLPLPLGKLPPEFLAEELAEIVLDDPSVLVGAGIGQDAAVIDVGSEEVLVLASDPITLAMDSLARYVVIANANDVATSGADPRWLLTTLMFPKGATASEILALAADIQEICSSCGVSLCGGHTEITDAVSRPVAVGTMAGTARADRVLDKSKMRPGDRILLTKGVAVEGTGLIAREYPSRLAAAGMTSEEIRRCAAFLEDISILEEARICHASDAVTALHDVTEGGLATAVRELGAAGGYRLRVDMAAIPVYPETARVCEVTGLDPFGLIGSGSLLIVCHPSGVADLAAEIERRGVSVTEIGEVLEPGSGIEAWKNGVLAEWPQFDRDEVSRLSRVAK